jgi:D-alanine-D-alanine ligase
MVYIEELILNIEIITTPNDNLKETGFGPLYACENIMQSLLNSNHNAVVTVCKNVLDLNSVIKRKPNLVVSAVKYIPLENGQQVWLSEYFENKGLNYTGSQNNILLYDSNKVAAKKQVLSKEIDTAKFFITSPPKHKSEQALPLPFPLFIKPTDSANGNGVDADSLAYDFIHFQEKVKSLYNEYAQPVLVEEYLDGREFTAAIIEKHRNLMVAPVEIIPPEENGVRILGAKIKTADTEVLKTITDTNILSKVIDIAEKSFRALGARDFGRIDIKMDHHGQCYFLEANLVPGMNKDSSYFPRACQIHADLDYDEVIRLIIQGAVERCNNTNL